MNVFDLVSIQINRENHSTNGDALNGVSLEGITYSIYLNRFTIRYSDAKYIINKIEFSRNQQNLIYQYTFDSTPTSESYHGKMKIRRIFL